MKKNNRSAGTAFRPPRRRPVFIGIVLTCTLAPLVMLVSLKNDPVLESQRVRDASSRSLSFDPSYSIYNNNNNNANNMNTLPLLPEPSPSSLRRKRALLDATNTMRCMLLPGCYPDVPCSDNQPPKKLPQGKSWEQHPFCTGDLASASAQAKKKQEKCLVYSFGVHDSTEWEQKMAREFECDVYAFDPTSKFEQNAAPGVTFHKLGLMGAGVDVSQTHSEMYDALDPTLLRTLGDIRSMLGHETRQVDVLRLDCEGCEWGVLKQLACSEDSLLVDQLMIEMHFQKNLGIATDDDLLIAADAITCLEDKRWGLVSMEFSGCDPKDAEYIPSMLKMIKPDFIYMLLFASFRRMPVEASLYKNNDGEFVKRFTTREVYDMKT